MLRKEPVRASRDRTIRHRLRLLSMRQQPLVLQPQQAWSMLPEREQLLLEYQLDHPEGLVQVWVAQLWSLLLQRVQVSMRLRLPEQQQGQSWHHRRAPKDPTVEAHL